MAKMQPKRTVKKSPTKVIKSVKNNKSVALPHCKTEKKDLTPFMKDCAEACLFLHKVYDEIYQFQKKYQTNSEIFSAFANVMHNIAYGGIDHIQNEIKYRLR